VAVGKDMVRLDPWPMRPQAEGDLLSLKTSVVEQWKAKEHRIVNGAEKVGY
jgi:hypothetical protein